ncbi:sucrase ferredoxin [Actinopolymorpha sp. B17G11]|uniref:sucrase ferredoxin n=1 Tax=Actinopolymorpha sp. B17G11 TaxID=3160861 RepID=UPI0032E3AF85
MELPATSCSVLSATLAEPLAGTAAAARTWMCIEQSGPYGPDALRESHLDHEIGTELVRRAGGTGVRLQLIRRPGRHADEHPPTVRRQVFLAHTRPGATWLVHGRVDDPRELLDLDLDALGSGVRPSFGRLDDRTLLLVCTNGRRDVCCALRGRPIAAELATRHGEQVWETTHTGGHRFAPTAVVLPSGYLYGRLDAGFADRLLTGSGSGQMVTERCRGRSTWSPAGQVAELAVRALTGETGTDALVIDDELVDGADWRVRVRDSAPDRVPATEDGGAADPIGNAPSGPARAWWVSGRVETPEPERRTSCAKAPVIPTVNLATGISEGVPSPLPG